MATLKMGTKNVVSQSGTAEPVVASNVVFPGAQDGSPAGHILRVFHQTSTADITVTSGTTIVTGCTQTLTPLSNTSKFLISHSFSGRYNSGSDTVFHVDIYYEGSAIGGKTNLNNFSTGNVNFPVSGSGSFLHSPSTASEITYDIRLNLFFGSGSCTLTSNCSQMTIMELQG